MRGNVWEWVQDWRAKYPADRQVDPQGPSSGDFRLNRGGAFYALESVGACWSRNQGPPKFRIDFIGFRCARSF
jgi:formylglycine-generating enzyme required for sulfatase activity